MHIGCVPLSKPLLLSLNLSLSLPLSLSPSLPLSFSHDLLPYSHSHSLLQTFLLAADFGASAQALNRMVGFYGYVPVAIDEKGINIFYVHRWVAERGLSL
jgi:hypothetical protein